MLAATDLLLVLMFLLPGVGTLRRGQKQVRLIQRGEERECAGLLLSPQRMSFGDSRLLLTQARWVWSIIFLCSMPLAAAILAAFGGFIAAGFAVLPTNQYWIMYILIAIGGLMMGTAWIYLVLSTLSIRGIECCASCGSGYPFSFWDSCL